MLRLSYLIQIAGAILCILSTWSCEEKEAELIKNPIVFNENSEHIIINPADGALDVFAADLDGDGDQDVLAALNDDANKIVWYKNDGSGNFSSQSIISIQDHQASIVYSSDLDKDGDQDVLAALNGEANKIFWFRNDGSGNFSDKQFITDEIESIAKLYVSDLDGDGNLDILSASMYDSKVAWYKNDGQGNFGEQRLIYHYTQCRSVNAADLDGDGDQDVLIAISSYPENTISWFRNDGSGNFGEEQFIVSQISGAIDVFATDLDGDNDQDVLSAFWDDHTITSSLNQGDGSFAERQVITTQAKVVTEIYPIDMDNDGDQDLISASWGDDKIAWYENDGKGNFGSQQIISNRANAATDVFAADLDGDGDQDILSVSSDKVAWYENSLY